MGRKVFVSYKFADANVAPLPSMGHGITTARDYVNELELHLDAHDCIFKGDGDGESLAGLSEAMIESKLCDKMYDSSTTVVIISPNMRDVGMSEREQWIPWEISYSLKEKTREDRTSSTNAMLAVALPDRNGRYDYFVEPLRCSCGGISWKNEQLFRILGGNMFNLKQPNTVLCSGTAHTPLHMDANHSFIYPLRWVDFVPVVGVWLDHAMNIRKSIADYVITKTV